MKKGTLISIFCLMIFTIMLAVSGCGSAKINSKLVGKWAYIHDKETCILEIKSNAEASYKGIRYKLSDDGSNLILNSNGNEPIILKYEIVKDDLYLYEPTTYVYVEDTPQDGLVGIWKVADVNWSFEFLDNGEFKEDGYFPGHYEVNEEEHTIKLMYNDHFEDTTCYYEIDGNELKVQYPWRMVKM